MIEVLTLTVFVLVAFGSSVVGLYVWASRTRAIDRLAPNGGKVAPILPSAVLIWQELVARVGKLVPASPKDLPRLKRRLIQAGFRSPDAPRLFRGIQGVACVVLAVVVLMIGMRSYLPTENLLLMSGAGAMAGFVGSTQFLLIRIRRRRRAIEKALPNVLDLMVVCVESGLGMDQTVIQVAKELMHAHPELCDELAVMNLELRAGKRRHEALHNLADRTGVEDIKKLVAVLIQTDRFGTSIAQSLRGHADYLRTLARQRAEEKASKLAVKLVFPIFFCVLPSLFVVTIGPVMTRLIRDLIPMIENM